MTGSEKMLLDALTSHQHTLTSATDWPMLMTNVRIFGIVIGFAWVSLVGIFVYHFKDLKNTIHGQKEDTQSSCTDCKKAIWEHISGPVWHAIESCCPRWSTAEKSRLRDEIKRGTGGTDVKA